MLDDSVAVFQAARKYEKKKLMDKIGDMWAESLSEMENLPSLTELDKESWVYILTRNDLEMTEVDLFRLALQWAGNQTDATIQESFKDILPLFRFSTMTLSEFATTVVPTKLLSPSTVMELVTYFGTDDKAKGRLLAETRRFSWRRWHLATNSPEYTEIYPNFGGNNTTKHQQFESLKDCLHFSESCPLIRRHLKVPEDLMFGIGMSGVTLYCPVASERGPPSFKRFKICLKSADCCHGYYVTSNQAYTQLLSMPSVNVAEGKTTDISFDAVIPLKQTKMYCITIEEVTSAQEEGRLRYYFGQDFGTALDHVTVKVKNRCRTALAIRRNQLEGFWKADSEQPRPQLICRLGFQKL